MKVEATQLSPALPMTSVPIQQGTESYVSRVHRAGPGEARPRLRDAVEGLISSALVLPALATLRESSLAAQPFAPGAAEKRFGPLLDQRIADEVTASANFPLVEALTEKLVRRYGLAPTENDTAHKEPLYA